LVSLQVNKAFRDFQEIKVQEHVHVMGIGSMPRAMQVFLLDDLVDAVKPGDDVTITGIVRLRFSSSYSFNLDFAKPSYRFCGDGAPSSMMRDAMCR